MESWEGQAHTDSPTNRAVQGLAKFGREVSLYYDLFALGEGCVITVSLLTHQGVHDYGIDWDGPITMDKDNTVAVPDFPLYVVSEQQKHILREELTHHPDDTYGIEHYVLTRHFMFEGHSPYQ